MPAARRVFRYVSHRYYHSGFSHSSLDKWKLNYPGSRINKSPSQFSRANQFEMISKERRKEISWRNGRTKISI